MSETQGFRHFDLPVDHIEVGETPNEDKDLGNWVPPQSHDQTEIKEISQKPGLLMARRQHTGTLVEARAMELSKDRELPPAFYKLLGAATFNSAFYEHGNGSTDVMRRRLWLPVPEELTPERDNEEEDENCDAIDFHTILTDQAVAQLEKASDKTGHKAAMVELTRSGNNPRLSKSIGRRLGNASLAIGTIPRADAIANAWDQQHQQEIVRASALDVRKASISLARHMGVYPSIAQFGDTRSPMVNHISNDRSRYSSAAIEVIEQAQVEVFDQEREARKAS